MTDHCYYIFTAVQDARGILPGIKRVSDSNGSDMYNQSYRVLPTLNNRFETKDYRDSLESLFLAILKESHYSYLALGEGYIQYQILVELVKQFVSKDLDLSKLVWNEPYGFDTPHRFSEVDKAFSELLFETNIYDVCGMSALVEGNSLIVKLTPRRND